MKVWNEIIFSDIDDNVIQSLLKTYHSRESYMRRSRISKETRESVRTSSLDGDIPTIIHGNVAKNIAYLDSSKNIHNTSLTFDPI